MEDERIDYSYLNVRELKVVCKFFKLDIPARSKRAELESLIILAQTRMAMATVEAYEYFMASKNQEDVELMDVADISNGLAKG
jgi:phosphoribosylformylglycinamidine (FGAM) synthase PurS component